jgi:hypothetical protein
MDLARRTPAGEAGAACPVSVACCHALAPLDADCPSTLTRCAAGCRWWRRGGAQQQRCHQAAAGARVDGARHRHPHAPAGGAAGPRARRHPGQPAGAAPPAAGRALGAAARVPAGGGGGGRAPPLVCVQFGLLGLRGHGARQVRAWVSATARRRRRRGRQHCTALGSSGGAARPLVRCGTSAQSPQASCAPAATLGRGLWAGHLGCPPLWLPALPQPPGSSATHNSSTLG